MLRRIGLPAGAVIVAVLVAAGPAAAAPATEVVSVHDGAHALFQDPTGGNQELMVDLDRTDGQTLLDVEWSDYTCSVELAVQTCVRLYREAYDVVPATAELSLDTTTVSTDLTYTELRRTCVDADLTDGIESRDCTDEPLTTGTTTLSLTLTGTGEIEQYEYRDPQGVLHRTDHRAAIASGTGFGQDYPVEWSLFNQLAHSVTLA